MRRRLPGVNHELAAAVRRINALAARCPEPLPDLAGERWQALEAELDRRCGAQDRDGAVAAISRWEEESSQILARHMLHAPLERGRS